MTGAEVVSVLRSEARHRERSRLRSASDGAMSPSDSCVAVPAVTGVIGHNFGQLPMYGRPARPPLAAQRPPSVRAEQVTHTHTADLVVQRNCACDSEISGPSGGCKDCHPEKLGLQPKLRVGARGDVREQEADRIAEQVMRIPGPARAGDSAPPEDGPLVQRCVSGDTPEQTEAPPIVHEVLASSGHPLDAAARAFFEPRFGHDFSRVRLHTDARAKKSGDSVDALAYTVGQHVVLGRGAPPMHSSEGRRVLAHELTHAIQQGAGATNRQPLESGVLARLPAPASSDSGPTGVPTLAFDPAAIPAFPWDLDPDVDLESTIMRDLYVFSLQQAWISLTSDPDTAYQLLASMRDKVVDARPLMACVDARDDESASVGVDKLLVELEGILELLELDTDAGHDELRTWFEGAASWMTELDPAFASVEQLGSVGSCGAVVLIPLIEGLDKGFEELDDDELRQFWGRLKTNALFSAVFPQAFMVGTVVGIGKEAKAVVEQVIVALTDRAAAAIAVKESIQGLADLVSELFSPTGAGLAREIGRSAVALLGTEIVDLNNQPGPPQFAYALGEKLGPQIVYVVLSLLGFEAFVAGRALLLAKKGLDGLRNMKAFSRIAGLLRRAPDVDLPISGPSSLLPKAFENWLQRLEEPTRTALNADPALLETYRNMDPEVRQALTRCGSLCIPSPPPAPADLAKITGAMKRLGIAGDHQGLREYLHDMRGRDGQQGLHTAAETLEKCQTFEDVQRIFDQAIMQWAKDLGGTAAKVGDRWTFTRKDGVVVQEWERDTYGSLAKDRATNSFFQAHHGVQDAWAKRVPGYKQPDCPAVLLRDSYAGSPHRRITDRQIAMRGSATSRTYAEERALMAADLKEKSEVPVAHADLLIKESDAYFGRLYQAWELDMHSKNMPPELVSANLTSVFGTWSPP